MHRVPPVSDPNILHRPPLPHAFHRHEVWMLVQPRVCHDLHGWGGWGAVVSHLTGMSGRKMEETKGRTMAINLRAG